MTTALEAFRATEDSMNARLVERQIPVRSLLLGLAGRLNVFFVGPPGVAKTMSATTLVDHIGDLPDNGYFWRLLTKFTAPQELFGPPDLLAMEKGVWRHVTDGTLVDCRISLLDEAFKGSSAILNSLLTYLNEGVFHNDEVIECPRWFTIALSNEIPSTDELNALADRFDFWIQVNPVATSDGFIDMLTSEPEPVKPTLTMAQIEAAHAEVDAVTIGDEVYRAILNLKTALNQEGIHPTDRRFRRGLQAVRAAAWYAGRDAAEVEDIRDLRHLLWQNPSQKQQVDIEVFKISAPWEANAVKLRDDIAELRREFNKIVADTRDDVVKRRSTSSIALFDRIERAIAEKDQIIAGLPKGKTSEAIKDVEVELKTMNDWYLKEVFGL